MSLVLIFSTLYVYACRADTYVLLRSAASCMSLALLLFCPFDLFDASYGDGLKI